MEYISEELGVSGELLFFIFICMLIVGFSAFVFMVMARKIKKLENNLFEMVLDKKEIMAETDEFLNEVICMVDVTLKDTSLDMYSRKHLKCGQNAAKILKLSLELKGENNKDISRKKKNKSSTSDSELKLNYT